MSQRTLQPVIGITMGDPAGIGPEVTVKALADPEVRRCGSFMVYGINEDLVLAAERAGITPFWWRVEHGSALVGQASGDPRDGTLGLASPSEQIVVVDHTKFADEGASALDTSRPSRHGGEASLAFVHSAVAAAMAGPPSPGRIDAMVTAPISKTSWALAGVRRTPGHTELIAERTGARRYAMMFVAPKLRVVLATIHVPLMEIRDLLTIGRVFEPIDLAHEACRDLLGIRRPRIAVCGLNPHASEGGLFGDEEQRVIEPAIRMAAEGDIDASGPYPADTIFNQAVEGKFDVVVAMYHDQGLIPVKLLARDEAVNVTIGLPIIRTSPDHGTAFDIAGRNQANPDSMKAAIRLAAQMATRRNK